MQNKTTSVVVSVSPGSNRCLVCALCVKERLTRGVNGEVRAVCCTLACFLPLSTELCYRAAAGSCCFNSANKILNSRSTTQLTHGSPEMLVAFRTGCWLFIKQRVSECLQHLPKLQMNN